MRKFFLDLYQIRPSQLYLDQSKIDRLEGQFDPMNIRNNMPLPVKKIGGEVFFTNGHARAYLYDKNKISMIPVYWDENVIDTDLYQVYLKWCREQQVVFIHDLGDRILPHDQFVEKWINRCKALENKLKGSN